MCGNEYIAREEVALVLHIEDLGCECDSYESTVTIGNEADHFWTSADTAESAEETECRSCAAVLLAVCAWDPDLDHVCNTLRANERLYNDFCFRTDRKEVILYLLTSYVSVIEKVKNFNDLFDKHNIFLLIPAELIILRIF